jgi:hypothetical protein
MTTQLQQNKTEKIAEFKEQIHAGLEAWSNAGETLVELLDEHKATYEEILEDMPEMAYDVLSRFEQIGRKQLYPKLLLSGSTGLRKLATLPYSEQVKYFDEPLDVVVEINGGIDVLKVKAKDLTPVQVKQVFHNGTIRDHGAQRSHIRSRKHASTTCSPEGNAYHIKGGTLVVDRPCKLSIKDLANIMAQMS